jgi:anti-sigma factor RsiW
MSLKPHPIPAEWLSAYYDGELDAARTAQVEAHLPGCLSCQQALAELSMLSETLEAGGLDDDGTEPTAFWQTLESQLPDRAPTATAVNGGAALRRWLPGIGLLVINGLVQVVGGATVIGLIFLPQLPADSNWLSALNNLVLGTVLGWPAWLLPAGWIDLGVTLFFVMISAGLAVLYLAWLGYELRYGPPASVRISASSATGLN